MNLIPVILSGGVGSRLWPVSRELHPKPFIQLSDGQSLLQKAFLRAVHLPGVTEVMTVTNRELLFKTEDEFREVNSSKVSTSFILEPFGRNTAAAIASAALQVNKNHGHDAILLVLAADHLISDQSAFQLAVADAVELAKERKLVTFGIRPDAPETGFGYIESEGNKVLRFVEKPSLEKAQEYLTLGHFLWNSGIFCFSAGFMLEQMQQHCPVILQATKKCIEHSSFAKGDGFSQLVLNADVFKIVPDDSIDYAVMEKSDQVAVIPCDIGWSDIGSWNALGDLDEPDAFGNRIQGEVMLHNTRNCIIQSDDRVVGTVGIENIIVIDTPDALLVANKANAQDVKHIYAELKTKIHETHKSHLTVHRPWGTYTNLKEENGYKVKRITVRKGQSLSMQFHHRRAEHWTVVRGHGIVQIGDVEHHTGPGEYRYIPLQEVHRLTNTGEEELVLIEVQVGDYLGEDDIVRLHDNYGRA